MCFFLFLFFFSFYAEIQDDHQKWQENNFWEKNCQLTMQIVWGSKILSKSLYLASFLNAFLCFTQKFKMVGKKIGKVIS